MHYTEHRILQLFPRPSDIIFSDRRHITKGRPDVHSWIRELFSPPRIGRCEYMRRRCCRTSTELFSERLWESFFDFDTIWKRSSLTTARGGGGVHQQLPTGQNPSGAQRPGVHR